MRNWQISAALFAVALALPLIFFDYRIEPFHCEADLCSVGEAGDLLVPLGSDFYPLGETGPSVVQKERGIFVRRGIPPLVAAAAGLLLPAALLVFPIVSMARHKGRKREQQLRNKGQNQGLSDSIRGHDAHYSASNTTQSFG